MSATDGTIVVGLSVLCVGALLFILCGIYKVREIRDARRRP